MVARFDLRATLVWLSNFQELSNFPRKSNSVGSFVIFCFGPPDHLKLSLERMSHRLTKQYDTHFVETNPWIYGHPWFSLLFYWAGLATEVYGLISVKNWNILHF